MTNFNGTDPSMAVRRAQLITPYGIGALTDINNQSVMIMGSKYWKWNNNDKEQFHDIRLERVMGANYFIEPPTKDTGSVKVTRFPNWLFSPKTKKLKTFEEWKSALKFASPSFDKKPYEFFKSEKIYLVPVRFMCTCRNGHVQDFPWFEWAHLNKKDGEDQLRMKHELSLFSSSVSDSISSIIVKCTCGCENSLRGIFDTDGGFAKNLEKIQVKCHGKFIWDLEKDVEEDIKDCDQPLQTVLRNANNFYFPNIVSSVNIPFSENKNIEKIKSNPVFITLEKLLSQQSMPEEYLKTTNAANLISLLASDTFLTEEQVRDAIVEDQLEIKSDEDVTVEDYRYDEYQVLMGVKDFDKNSGRLNITECNFKNQSFHGLEEKIGKLTLVNQLEVVNVLKSYSRIEPTDSERMVELQQEENPSSYHRVSEVSLINNIDRSYVGIKNLGEGIFVSLDKKMVNLWKKRLLNSKIESKINRKIKNNIHEDELKYITPVFYLIHTLSHLLIRELNAYCGYSSSALKERIYFSEKKGKEMYGLLIYTSSSDSEGTLGGLVKQCLPERFFKILNSAIEKARWCSYDPVCIGTDSQGRDSLNSAACHACTLISETSCDKMNSFLDRTVLIGSPEELSLGYFN
ncbi:hypothetical protein LFYK43_06360 [Ligilactobacillus salitolerans]|uniref:MrfA-like Zn-binding domain-containing protein n=1 Tax=Ligilactobacillus salitolerans TaxID=1808352 RepID=A0A401IRN4_9LACO|nr:DUF1998 domain-containing protein [Ligilactobacillus salitolerans]GBG94177.1 hypothetical protein LFYK43_06360 [Ligilactobacillus salitolerans]